MIHYGSPSQCQICSKPTYCREIEELEPVKQEQFTSKQWDVVNQLRLNQGNLREKFAELYKKKNDGF